MVLEGLALLAPGLVPRRAGARGAAVAERGGVPRGVAALPRRVDHVLVVRADHPAAQRQPRVQGAVVVAAAAGRVPADGRRVADGGRRGRRSGDRDGAADDAQRHQAGEQCAREARFELHDVPLQECPNGRQITRGRLCQKGCIRIGIRSI